jgi:hypothetical protein
MRQLKKERNTVVNLFAEYIQSAYYNPFPEVFTTTLSSPHNCRYQVITSSNLNSYSEIFVTDLKYFHPPFTSAVFLNPSKASSGHLSFSESTVMLLAITSILQRYCC